MLEQFARTNLLLGPEALERLEAAHVAVFGIGGVGGYVVEALARSGVGALSITDSDTVDITNLNRQIIATHQTVGRSKVQVMAERVASINPHCQVTTHECFYLPETADQFDFARYDYVVDAVDTVTAKLQLARAAQDADVPLIASMGTANKLDPTAFRVAMLSETSICPLARIMRKECRKRGIRDYKVLYSEETPLQPHADEELLQEARASGRRSVPGSVPFVPPVAGLILAGEVVKDLTHPEM